MSLLDALRGDDRRASLVALRDRLAEDVEAVDERYRAPLYKQLADVLRELDSIPSAERKSVPDDLKQQRAKRRAAASGQ